MFIIVKFVPVLNEWWPLPVHFDTRAAAVESAKAIGGKYRVERAA